MITSKPLLVDAYVSENYAPGEDLVRVLQKLHDALKEEDTAVGVSALYTMAVLSQAPNLSDEDLQKVVWEISKRACSLLAGSETPTSAVVN